MEHQCTVKSWAGVGGGGLEHFEPSWQEGKNIGWAIPVKWNAGRRSKYLRCLANILFCCLGWCQWSHCPSETHFFIFYNIDDLQYFFFAL